MITFSNLDKFAYIGGFSPAVPSRSSMPSRRTRGVSTRRSKCSGWAPGTVERAGNPNILRLHEALDQARVKNVYYESPGTAHEWLTWRRDLYQFAPLLFRY